VTVDTRVLAALLGLTTPSPSLAAQTGGGALEELRTPVSPAFVLLDLTPSAVERPTTPKALAATLLAATGDLQVLPRNYAVEVAPYWLAPHPTLTYTRFHNPGPWQSVKQTASISFATVRSSGTGIVPDSSTAIGLGVRTFLATGHPDRPALDSLTARLDAIQQQQNLAAFHHRPQDELDSLKQQNDHATRALQALVQERRGFMLEAAAGAVAVYPQDVFARGTVSRVGAWLTPTYRMRHPQVDVLVVGRLIRDVAAGATRYDAGGRFVYANRGLSISGEYVSRSGGSGAQRTHRASGNLEYRWAEGKYLTATFGRNFDAPAGGGRTLIALVGIDLGFGKVPILSVK
jgi:hypothetical protein